MIRIASAVGLLPVASACAGPGDEVPAGCEPAADRVTWSSVRTTPVLVKAELNRAGGGPALLDEPFTPSITGVRAPDGWLTDLSRGITEHLGTTVHVTAPYAEGQVFSILSGGGASAPLLFYTGIQRVTADFAVRCEPPVRGAFAGWTETVTGGVACQHVPDVELDVFGRQALRLCPNLSTAPGGS